MKRTCVRQAVLDKWFPLLSRLGAVLEVQLLVAVLVHLGAPRCRIWRDAVRGARWGLEYLDLLRDMLASELTFQG